MRGRGDTLRRAASRGFTLVELQIAIVVLLIVTFTMGGHHHIYNQLLAGVSVDQRVDGHFDLFNERGFLVIMAQGKNASAPVCDVRVQSVDTSGSDPEVVVVVEQVPF